MTRPAASRALAAVLVALAAGAVGAAGAGADGSPTDGGCGPARDSGPVHQKGKVSHAGWPAIDGILWQSRRNGLHVSAGTPRNDELLGAHGSDRLSGGDGHDVLWGDEVPCCQPGGQHDVLDGGAGDDWIYASHGANTIRGGAGADHIHLYYGHGTVDCGPGKDTAWVRRLERNRRYRLKRCERLKLY